MKKAQMFVITMVFLAGLVVAVQQILIQYSELDISRAFGRTDSQLLENIRDGFNRTMGSSECCPVALERLEEMDGFLSRRGSGSYFLELEYNGRQDVNLACGNFNTDRPVLNLTVKVTTGSAESEGSFSFLASDSVPPSVRNIVVTPDPGGKNLAGVVFNATAMVADCSGIENVSLRVKDMKDVDVDVQGLYDDGGHGDIAANDSIYTGSWNSTGSCVNPFGCSYLMYVEGCDVFGNCREEGV